MATIRDVAKVARVSTATVSATLNQSAYVSPQLRSRVLQAIEQVDYQPDGIARSLRRGVTETLGLVVSDITDPYTTAVVHSMEARAQHRGYTLMLCNSDEQQDKEQTYLRLLRSHRVDGVLLVPTSDGPDYAEQLRGLLTSPFVLVDRVVSGLRYDAVTTDGAGGTRAAVAHLLGLGHRRVGILAGPASLSTGRERLAGYFAALDAAGIESDPVLVRDADFQQEAAHRATHDLLDAPDPPTALFACNNLMAIGMMRAIAERGMRCPDDVSVACFDDADWATGFQPQMTTVAQPTEEIGSAAIDLLVGRLQGRRTLEPRHVVLSPALVVRGSCAPPRAVAV